MNIGMIPDIPKIYTALAEWLSCLFYISLYKKRISNKKISIVLSVSLVLLLLVQVIIGIIPKPFWLLGMCIAGAIMFISIDRCCAFSKMTSGYCLVRAFILAEFAAALEWQLYYYCVGKYNQELKLVKFLFLIVIFGVTYGGVYLIETRRKKYELQSGTFSVTKRELISAALLGLAAFAVSNLSYVYAYTPFSSQIATEVFNIRTLVDLGGVALLYAYHLQLEEYHMKGELDSIQNILRSQYAQYKQSRENIDIIHRQYHDLKHQIAALRAESDPDKRETYLYEMEQELKSYEAENKTGNAVLDTVLTGKSLYCQKHGITLTCVADGTLLDFIYVMDICTIFGNALDNAIECELLIPDTEKRLIHVSVSQQNNFILIRVENYFEGELNMQNGIIATTKGDNNYHGYGIKSIGYSVKKYGGFYTIHTNKNWFELKILIPKQDSN